jgi:hypothetical protein
MPPPRWAATEPMQTIAPLRRDRIDGTTARDMLTSHMWFVIEQYF